MTFIKELLPAHSLLVSLLSDLHVPARPSYGDQSCQLV